MTVQTKTENALDRFVNETRELFAEETDPERRWTALSPILAKLLADPTVIEAAKHWPDCVSAGGRAENLLFYEDPDYDFVINGLKKLGHGRTTGIHDHGSKYTLYGVLDGRERIQRYERIDDRSKPDFAEIVKSEDFLVGPGEIDLVPPYGIHSEANLGEPTTAIVIRSERLGVSSQGGYSLETGEYRRGFGPRQTPCEMFPSA